MANVLGELFSDIAESIRSGLGGYNGTMKPVEFAGKIDEIVAMLEEEVVSRPAMGGMASTSNLKIAKGNFSPEADRTRITIEHGLGVMPDIIMVYQSGPPVGYDTVADFVDAYPILSAWGVKSSVNVTTRSGMNLPGWGFATAYGIDDMPEEERPGGYIYCPDEDTFQVGRQATDGAVGLAANLDYYWVAISGIGSGAAEPVVQALTVTENGTYTPPEGVDGYSPVTVNVPAPVLQDKTITENGEYTADAGFDALGKVLVNVAGSGGGSMAVKAGTFTGNGGAVTVNHNLGCVPLAAWLCCTNSITGDYEIATAMGISREAATITGKAKPWVRCQIYRTSAGRYINSSSYACIDEKESSDGYWFITDATETSITFGSTSNKTQNGHTYEYFLIGSKKE